MRHFHSAALQVCAITPATAANLLSLLLLLLLLLLLQSLSLPCGWRPLLTGGATSSLLTR
jgi:hypothetical protein